ncbi:MAG TPA: hypothetical protein VMW76_09615 [Bacteroidales bacterium]|nr:hypothetical protein [Bacteroidales bacterium]
MQKIAGSKAVINPYFSRTRGKSSTAKIRQRTAVNNTRNVLKYFFIDPITCDEKYKLLNICRSFNSSLSGSFS